MYCWAMFKIKATSQFKDIWPRWYPSDMFLPLFSFFDPFYLASHGRGQTTLHGGWAPSFQTTSHCFPCFLVALSLLYTFWVQKMQARDHSLEDERLFTDWKDPTYGWLISVDSFLYIYSAILMTGFLCTTLEFHIVASPGHRTEFKAVLSLFIVLWAMNFFTTQDDRYVYAAASWLSWSMTCSECSDLCLVIPGVTCVIWRLGAMPRWIPFFERWRRWHKFSLRILQPLWCCWPVVIGRRAGKSRNAGIPSLNTILQVI